MSDGFSSPERPYLAALDEGDLDLRARLQVLRRHWLLIVLVVLVGGVAGYVNYAISPRIYQAKTLIQIERRSLASQLGSEASADYSYWVAHSEYYPTQYELLRSRGLAEEVVRDLRLDEDPRFNRAVSQASEAAMGSSGAAADEAAVAGLAQRLLAGLQVNPVRQTQLVEILYQSPDPELAAEIANGFARAYIDWTIEYRQAATSGAAEFLAREIDQLRAAIQEKDRQIKELSKTVNVLPLEGGTEALKSRLASLNESLSAAARKRIERQARHQELLRASPESVAEVEAAPAVDRLKQDHLRLQREYETKLETFKRDWPAMVDLRGEIERVREHLNAARLEELERVRGRAYSEYQTALREEAELVDEINELRGNALASSSQAVELANLQSELETRQAQLEGILRRQSQTEAEARLQATGETNVRIVDRALVPSRPFQPSLRKNALAGLGGGAALGMAFAFLLNFLDRTVKDPDEVERLLGLPTLAVIPDVSEGRFSGGRYGFRRAYGYGRSRGRSRSSPEGAAPTSTIELIPEAHPRLAVSEAYRSLRAALLLSSAEKLEAVCVTSASSGEGKTATSANLAVVLAQLDRRVLLIDGDLRQSRQHQIFNVSNRTGLVSCLTGSSDPADAVFETEVENLFLVPAGPPPPNPSELLASERLAKLLDHYRDTFDVVILDSPPVLAVSDPILIGARCDGVVFCVQAGESHRDELVSAGEQLSLAGVKALGTVLNRYRPALKGSYYGRRYHYYQPYAASEEADSAA